MAHPNHYVPILKGKAGEFHALKLLDKESRNSCLPMLEIPAIPWDFDLDAPKTSLDKHLERFAKRVCASWSSGAQLLIDAQLVENDGLVAGVAHPIAVLAQAISPEVARLIPVTGLGRSESYQLATRDAAGLHGHGASVRLEREDILDLDALQDELKLLLEILSLDPTKVDLIVDLRELSEGDEVSTYEWISDVLRRLPLVNAWRRLVLSGSSFPENLSSLRADTSTMLPRVEWSIWKALRRTNSLPRLPLFADYAIAHPSSIEVDPKKMRMSANIRYTLDSNWLVLRGRSVQLHGYAQFNRLSSELVMSGHFSGPEFSPGDRYIARCAQGIDGPGNATTWRWVGSAHHLTMVGRQLSALADGL